ncbi:MAG: DnaJ domain-containing protein [Pararhizobium sp.]
MRDPYAVLGVDRKATVAEIKSAYRSLAKKWHPDRHRDDPTARDRFVEIGEAYQSLIHPRLRDAMFTATAEAEAAPARNRRGKAPREEKKPEETADDMLERIFGRAAKRAHVADAPGIETETETTTAAPPGTAENADQPGAAAPPAAERPTQRQRPAVLSALNALFRRRTTPTPASALPQPTLTLDVAVPLKLALEGGEMVVALPDGNQSALAIPAGIADGARLPVSAAGDGGRPAPVEALIRHERSDAWYSDGADLHAVLPIGLDVAILGGSAPFETLDGSIRLTVPVWSGSDRTLRVKDRGLPKADGMRGDLYVHLRILLPEIPDARLIDLMKTGKEGFYV